MNIFIDFDGVIFNTEAFKRDLSRVFAAYGAKRGAFQRTYDEMRAHRETYSIVAHARLLKQEGEIKDFPSCVAALERFMRDLRQYVFLDALFFLRHHQKQGLFLVSFGDAAFQRSKIECSAVKKYFKRIVVTQGNKAEEISILNAKNKEKKPRRIVFIDDNEKHIREARSIASAVIIQVLRKGRKETCEKSAHANHHVSTLRQASKIIASL